MKVLLVAIGLTPLALAGCGSTPDPTAPAVDQTPRAQPVQVVKLTPEQELARYCRVCVVDSGEKMEEYLPTRLDTKRDGKTYRFCTDGCRKKFAANPGRYTLK